MGTRIPDPGDAADPMTAGLVADATAVTAGLVAAGVVAAAAGWLVLRLRGPVHALQAARRALDRGDHDTALALARRHRPAPNAPPKPWHAEQFQLESEALYAAGEGALRDRRFADALEHYRAVTALVGMDEAEAGRRVVEAMLAEARRLSATDPEGAALPELLGLILDRQSPCPEASFWLGLYHLRRGDAAAAADLEAAHAATHGRQVDPALYLGAVRLRDGKPRDALRVLAEANRLAPHCPVVAWQLGVALTESGGDPLLALRAFQKATAPEGLPKYLHTPHRLWTETLPPDSWVRNLVQRAGTQKAHFHCPLGLDRIGPVLQRARLALAEALVTCDRAEDAVAAYGAILPSHDTPPVRRGLGLALVQLRRYDEALPHLKKAHAQEKPPSAVTTGALAACLAHAGGDRGANVRRALGLIASLNVRADAAWARHAGAVFAAAQAAGVAVPPDQVAELANILASTDATDPTAAEVYDLLAGLRPDAVPADAARLYLRAAQRHGVRLGHDEPLFAAAMADREATRTFFAAREWDFDAAERLYLERWAERHPGTFPTAPGPGYPAAAEAALLADARRLAGQNRPDAARDVAKLVLKLRPTSGPAHDLLAELAYRRGDRSKAVERLKKWHAQSPADPLPLARLAAFAAADHKPAAALALARQALDRARGAKRLPYLLLAARLALAAGKPADAAGFFDACLALSPNHPTALAGRAAVAWADADFATFVCLAEQMAAVRAEDPWFFYLTGTAQLVAGNLDGAELAARQAAADPVTAAEGRHLLALVRDRRNDTAGAAQLLNDPSVAAGSAADHAFALRGQAAWRSGDYAEALRSWQAVPAARLKTWNLAALLGGTAFMAGLQALRANDPAEAAKWLRQAAKLGHADPRLGALLAAASTRAGGGDRSIDLLEQALEAGGLRPEVVRQLARAYRHAGRLADARRLLDRARSDEPLLALERGLLFLAEGHLVPAERAFAAALEHDPQSAAACVNLVFTRLSLGRFAEAAELLPWAAALAPKPAQQRLLTQLHLLAKGVSEVPAGWSAEDDRAVVHGLRSLARLESVEPLFDALKAVRGESPVVQKAETELVPLRGKDRLDRGDPAAARTVLETYPGPHPPPVVRNLLGVAACLQQDFQQAVRHFQAALPKVGDDARVQQNLALVRGWMGDAERAAAHWERFLEVHAGQTPKPPGVADYHRRIAALVRERMKENVEVS